MSKTWIYALRLQNQRAHFLPLAFAASNIFSNREITGPASRASFWMSASDHSNVPALLAMIELHIDNTFATCEPPKSIRMDALCFAGMVKEGRIPPYN